jgi:hypothetical protein
MPAAHGFLLSLCAVVALGASPALAAGSGNPVRITAATNLALRQTPSASATVVAYLPLGTEVTEVGPLGLDKTWLHVKLADNREGWLLATLTRLVEPSRRTATVEAIIVDRLGRRGDGPPACIEVVDLIERESAAVNDPQTAARFDLYHLRAVSTVLAAIRLNLGKRDPYMSWLDRHKSLVAYDEPGGRWLLSNAAVWQIHDQHPEAAAADEIAWLAVTNGLPGECQGSLVCYVDTLNKLDGEYLRRHPTGRHADDAAARIKDAADQLGAGIKTHSVYVFDKTRDCTGFTRSVDALAASIAAATCGNRNEVLQSLAGIKSACK